MDKADEVICDFIARIIDMLEEANEHNAGLELRIYPHDVHKLYSAFKEKKLI